MNLLLRARFFIRASVLIAMAGFAGFPCEHRSH